MYSFEVANPITTMARRTAHHQSSALVDCDFIGVPEQNKISSVLMICGISYEQNLMYMLSIPQWLYGPPGKSKAEASSLLSVSCSFFSGGLLSYLSAPLISTYFTLIGTSLDYYFLTSTL
jgi:hypothetical protein